MFTFTLHYPSKLETTFLIKLRLIQLHLRWFSVFASNFVLPRNVYSSLPYQANTYWFCMLFVYLLGTSHVDISVQWLAVCGSLISCRF